MGEDKGEDWGDGGNGIMLMGLGFVGSILFNRDGGEYYRGDIINGIVIR